MIIKIILILILIFICYLGNIKITSVNLSDFQRKEFTINLIDNNHISVLKCLKGTTLFELAKDNDIDLSNTNYNLQYILKNNDTITINKKLLSINYATSKELENIPYINNKLAIEIVKYRNDNGFYTSFEELLKVKGLGASKLEILKKYLTL
ncbi:MAG: helix-hairpin-helix domain-containing protein [Erysipelotrichaceae bacterium]|nr:helix-hairpin-helix domain-containing protein [Erysipelotrichaceae bacterium]